MDKKQQADDLGQPGEIRQYERHDDGANESGSNSNKEAAGTPIYFTTDSTLQTPEEHRHDESIDPRKDDTISASNDDLHDTVAGRASRNDNSIEQSDES